MIGSKLSVLFSYFIFTSVLCLSLLHTPNCFAEITEPPHFDSNDYDSLALLGGIWGDLKYFGKKPRKGKLDWDKVLLESLKSKFNGQTSYTSIFKNLVEQAQGKKLNRDNQDILNIANEIKAAYKPGKNYYSKIKLEPTSYHFKHEINYTDTFPSLELRVLALYRMGNIFYYFYPYRELLPKSRFDFFKNLLPDFVNAKNSLDYYAGIAKVANLLHDGHASCLNDYVRNLLFNDAYVPGLNLYVGNGITRVYDIIPSLGADSLRGAEVLKISNTDINIFINNKKKYIIGPRPEIIERYIGWRLICGKKDSKISFLLEKNGDTISCNLKRTYFDSPFNYGKSYYFKTQPFNDSTYFVNLFYDIDRKKQRKIIKILKKQDYKYLVLDIRGYPDFYANRILRMTASKGNAYINTRVPKMKNPGKFSFSKYRILLFSKRRTKFKKIFGLIDVNTRSASEFFSLELKSVSNITFIGSNSAGAAGVVYSFYIPGNFNFRYTGQAWYGPNQIQGTGITPDIKTPIRNLEDLKEKIQKLENN